MASPPSHHSRRNLRAFKRSPTIWDWSCRYDRIVHIFDHVFGAARVARSEHLRGVRRCPDPCTDALFHSCGTVGTAYPVRRTGSEFNQLAPPRTVGRARRAFSPTRCGAIATAPHKSYRIPDVSGRTKRIFAPDMKEKHVE